MGRQTVCTVHLLYTRTYKPHDSTVALLTGGSAGHGAPQHLNTRAVSSSPPDSTMLPSLLKHTSCTPAVWPHQVATHAAVRRSHSRTPPSRQALATSGWVGCHARRVMGCGVRGVRQHSRAGP